MVLRRKHSETRPEFEIEKTQSDRFLEVAGWAVLAFLWFFVLYNFSTLPDQIPTHFGASGQPDEFGSKFTFFLLPVIGTVLFLGFGFLNNRPWLFNFPVTITEKNRKLQYSNALRMMRFLKVALLVVFSVITYKTHLTATGATDGLGVWFLPFTLILILVPTAFFFVKSYRNK